MRYGLRCGLVVLSSLLAGSCGGGGGSPTSGFQSGQYDGTFTQNGAFTSASFALQGSTMTGYLTQPDEGGTSGSGCTRTMSRYEVTLTLSGEIGTGSVSQNVQYQGSSCPQSAKTLLNTINVRRTSGTGTGFNNLEGTWEVTAGTTVTHFTLVGGTFTGDYASRPGNVSLRFTGQLADPTVSLRTDSAIELAAIRH